MAGFDGRGVADLGVVLKGGGHRSALPIEIHHQVLVQCFRAVAVPFREGDVEGVGVGEVSDSHRICANARLRP